jgi:hypothetical protein
VKRKIATVVTLAGVLTLAGCSAPATPATPGSTLIVTHDGTSPLDDDPFVLAARASELGATLAWNLADFTIPELTSTTTAERIEQIYQSYLDAYITGGVQPEGYSGPPIWAPITVAARGDDEAQLTICAAAQDLSITSDNTATNWKLVDGTQATIVMGRDPATGNLVITDSQRTEEKCDASEALVRRFDPVPSIPSTISESEVVAPPGR